MISSDSAGAREAQGAPALGDLGRHEDAIRALVTRLARTHPSGGKVIERAAILAAGANMEQVMSWIAAHAGQPETTAPAKVNRGLHASRTAGVPPPQRYVLPAEALDS